MDHRSERTAKMPKCTFCNESTELRDEHTPPVFLLSEEQGLPCVADVHSCIHLFDFLRKSEFVDVLGVASHDVVSIQSPHLLPWRNRAAASETAFLKCLIGGHQPDNPPLNMMT